jgi:hypothetical protein
MTLSILAPFMLSFTLLSAALSAIPLLIETRSDSIAYEPISHGPSEDSPSNHRGTETATHDGAIRNFNDMRTHQEHLNLAVQNQSDGFKSAVNAIQQFLGAPTIRFCLGAFFVKRLAFSSESFMFQYASERFLRPLRDTAKLRVISSSSATFATMAVGPAMSYTLVKRYNVQAEQLDLNTVRMALLTLAIAFFGALKASSLSTLKLGK